MYRIFYNHESVGDVLMIVFNNLVTPNKVVKDDNVTSLYKDDELIGINIFEISKIMKIHFNGMLVAPNKEFIKIINYILENHHLPKLEIIESGFRVGKILTCEEHPDSDHLHVTTVDVKDQILDIVCGAPNCKEGEKVVVAMPGTIMFDGSVIVPSSFRGVKSNGMMCSARELHLPNAPQVRGLLILDDTYNVGDDFFKEEIGE